MKQIPTGLDGLIAGETAISTLDDGLHLRGYAIVGAAQRLSEISQEAADILRVFPELRGRVGAAGARVPQAESAGSAAPSRRRRGGRRKMSAAGRKRISDAQKARWARLRASRK